MKPIPTSIKKILPMLGSDVDGEVLNAVRAIGRQLKAAGLDWHELVKAINFETPVSHKSRRPKSSHPSTDPYGAGGFRFDEEFMNQYARDLRDQLRRAAEQKAAARAKSPFGEAKYYDWNMGTNEAEHETATQQAARIKREFEEKLKREIDEREWKKRRWEGFRRGDAE